MRQIKFRAWVGSEKRMERDMFYINQWDGKCHYTQPYHYEHEDDVKIYDCGEEEPILMQYTGLKDKNGIEIYEGDILRDKDWYMYSVENWEGAVFRLVTYGMTWDFLFQAYSKGLLKDELEIVGNIYEHPGLVISEQNVQASVATGSDSSNEADKQNQTP